MDYDKTIEEMTATLQAMVEELNAELNKTVDPFELPSSARKAYFELDTKKDALESALIALKSI
jgi:hypothetical protein